LARELPEGGHLGEKQPGQSNIVKQKTDQVGRGRLPHKNGVLFIPFRFQMIFHFVASTVVVMDIKYYECNWPPSGIVTYLCTLVRNAQQTWLVQKVDNAIQQVNRYPVDSVVCFLNTYPLDSDLSSR